MDITIDRTAFRIIVAEANGRWLAHAVREDSGERLGIEVAAGTHDEAAARLRRWLEWQREHSSALAALQAAERAYHRARTDAAFADAPDTARGEASRISLEALDAARARLDEVRSRRPAID
jgi:hypothetical protein